MDIGKFLHGFLHSDLAQSIEEFALHELIALIKKLYPEDVLLNTFLAKIEQEILKLQK